MPTWRAVPWTTCMGSPFRPCCGASCLAPSQQVTQQPFLPAKPCNPCVCILQSATAHCVYFKPSMVFATCRCPGCGKLRASGMHAGPGLLSDGT